MPIWGRRQRNEPSVCHPGGIFCLSLCALRSDRWGIDLPLLRPVWGGSGFETLFLYWRRPFPRCFWGHGGCRCGGAFQRNAPGAPDHRSRRHPAFENRQKYQDSGGCRHCHGFGWDSGCGVSSDEPLFRIGQRVGGRVRVAFWLHLHPDPYSRGGLALCHPFGVGAAAIYPLLSSNLFGHL